MDKKPFATHDNPKAARNWVSPGHRAPREIIIGGKNYGTATPQRTAGGNGWKLPGGEWKAGWSAVIRATCRIEGIEVPKGHVNCT
jgi:hypothetical protein